MPDKLYGNLWPNGTIIYIPYFSRYLCHSHCEAWGIVGHKTFLKYGQMVGHTRMHILCTMEFTLLCINCELTYHVSMILQKMKGPREGIMNQNPYKEHFLVVQQTGMQRFKEYARA
jgi:hypothetical protein